MCVCVIAIHLHVSLTFALRYLSLPLQIVFDSGHPCPAHHGADGWYGVMWPWLRGPHIWLNLAIVKSAVTFVAGEGGGM